MKQLTVTYFLIACISAGFGYVAHSYLSHRESHVCLDRYEFLNGEVVCGQPDVIRKTGYVETRREIEERINELKKMGTLLSAAVYFRDLEHGPTFGVNELESFVPASLLKLPLAFVFFASAEKSSTLLDSMFTYSGTTTVTKQRTMPIESAASGESYALKDLLRFMISYSDNASYEVLESFISDTESNKALRLEIFQELGLIDPKDRAETTLTVRGYASLFRILYNASYLDAGNSELLLSWLEGSAFAEGLVAGVPESTTVAHKFGERDLKDGIKELHDCGIVYYPENPYLLCVMTRGTDWDAQTRLIRDISRTVYEEVDSRRL